MNCFLYLVCKGITYISLIMARRRIVLQICDLQVISFHLHCTCLFISQYLLGVKLIHIYVWIYGIKLLVFKDYLKVFN
jgi:hypothetical protein